MCKGHLAEVQVSLEADRKTNSDLTYAAVFWIIGYVEKWTCACVITGQPTSHIHRGGVATSPQTGSYSG